MGQALITAPHRARLPVILVTAAVQGWALYGLHRAIMAFSWPATDHAWLFAFYALAVLIPVSVEVLADRATRPATWGILACMAAALFYFGWHHGSAVDDLEPTNFVRAADELSLVLPLAILWLLVLPFVQARLAVGKWTAEYQFLFAYSWRNVIAVAEAVAFTGCFWLLLILWQSLFHMLGMDFFQELFEKPVFIYPVTSIVFGIALHLIGSIDRFVASVLEQILSVFQWLGTLIGALLALFTLALVIKLPGLLFTGNRAIGAVWLLWLVAVVVLFLNAAYRDGAGARAYPKWIATALQFVVPLTTVIALTALYALCIRTARYGLTVDRVWAFIVAAAALIYSVGYSVAAFNRTIWFGGVARVNVMVALSLVAVLSLNLTPVLSPYRLAADSQYHRVLTGHFEATPAVFRSASPFEYLRFDAGRYGRRKLQVLARLENHADAPRIHELATAALAAAGRWQPLPTRTSEDLLSRMRVFPVGRTVEPNLAVKLRVDLSNNINVSFCAPRQGQDLLGLYVDLDGDGADEFVVLNGCGGTLYQLRGGRWERAGTVSDTDSGRGVDLGPDLAKGEVTTARRAWQDLLIGKRRFQVFPQPQQSARSPTRPDSP